MNPEPTPAPLPKPTPETPENRPEETGEERQRVAARKQQQAIEECKLVLRTRWMQLAQHPQPRLQNHNTETW